MRLLILILAIALLAFILKALFHKPAPVKRSPNKFGEKMVPCAVCELHLPASEAVREGERYFCSREHRQQWLDSAPRTNNRQ
jgi:uncharacterized protein